MAWAPKINRHCAYLQQKTVGANEEYVKRRPAVITGIAADAAPILRVGHTGEVYGNETTGVPLRTSPEQVGVYVPY